MNLSRLEDAMATRIIDISVALENDIASDPPGHEPRITYVGHQQSAPAVCRFFPGLTPADLPDGEGWAMERIDISTHNGTHLDAPWHFASTMDGGKRSSTIALEIVVVNTSAGVRYGQPDYVPTGCGMGREATLYLTSRGVRITGTDAWSWDAPFVHTAKKYAETRNAKLIWEGHKSGREIGYCHIEKLHNLEALPATGFKIACFPVKIKKASAGWTRAVAIVED
jgi:kynurenine formamidase